MKGDILECKPINLFITKAITELPINVRDIPTITVMDHLPILLG